MLPDLSVLPFPLPSNFDLRPTTARKRMITSANGIDRSAQSTGCKRAPLLSASANSIDAHDDLQALLGSDGIMLLQILALQWAKEDRSEEAVGLLKASLVMLDSGIDRAHGGVVLGRTLAHFGRHEQALVIFDTVKDVLTDGSKDGPEHALNAALHAAPKSYPYRLALQLCASHALSLCALARAHDALAMLDTQLPAKLMASVVETLTQCHGDLNCMLPSVLEVDVTASYAANYAAWAAYLLARARVSLALHKPMDAIALLDKLSTDMAAVAKTPSTFQVDDIRVCQEREALDIAVAEALLLRAAALLALQRPMLAIAPLEQRMLVIGDDAPALVLYGQALTSLGEPAYAVDRFEQALRVAPHFAPAYRYMASALVMQKLDHEALSCLRAARRLKPDWPEAWLDEAGIRLRRGELSKGFAAYEWREGARHAASHGATFWNGDDDIAGQSILILAEQGLGDTLHFIRYVPMVVALAREVIVEVPESLQSLLSEFAERAGFRVITPGDPRPSCERFTLLMSLPHAVNTRMETIPSQGPYLAFAALQKREANNKRKGNDRDMARAQGKAAADGRALRIGIVPAGNPAFANDQIRSIPLSAFAPLLVRPDVEAVLLQAAPREADRIWADAHPESIKVMPLEGDFSDTAEVIGQLDLVISVDTALAHLTGAMDLPV